MNQYHRNNSKKLSSTERLLRSKADAFIKAEKEFWKHRYELEDSYRQNAQYLNLDIPRTLPNNLSSIVWALKDGVVFVRYSSQDKKGDVDFRVSQMSLEEWGRVGLFAPTSKGELSLAQIGLLGGTGNISLRNCNINGIAIDYVEFKHAFYENQELLPEPIECAIIDFQLTLQGLQFNDNLHTNTNHKSTLVKLKEIAKEFANLLDNTEREEALQKFLKKHPSLLHPAAEIIPKQKLGEDFITDFVLVTTNQQGAKYTFVEIERASHQILNKDYALSAATTHAVKQVRDWDIWLEKNKSYLQHKLIGFESPEYLIVIGRGKDLDDSAKEHLRSHNRSSKNTQLKTYDDLKIEFDNYIARLEKSIEEKV